MQDVAISETNGTAAPHGTTNEDLRDQLAELKQMLDVISRLACPVCAPVVIAENHPEAVTIRHD